MQRKQFVGDSSSKSGCAQFVYHTFLFFLTGIMTYSLVSPQSFFGVLVFLVLWPIVQVITMVVFAFLIAAIASIFIRN